MLHDGDRARDAAAHQQTAENFHQRKQGHRRQHGDRKRVFDSREGRRLLGMGHRVTYKGGVVSLAEPGKAGQGGRLVSRSIVAELVAQSIDLVE